MTTARTLNDSRQLDQALMAAVGFGNTGGDVFNAERAVPGARHSRPVPTSQLLDTYSPAVFCTIRNFHDVEPKVAASLAATAIR